jgi:hypothetical protein
MSGLFKAIGAYHLGFSGGAALERLEQVAAMVSDLHARDSAKPEINSKARYTLGEAADFLHTSPSTLRRRAKVGQFSIVYDGKTPFVMGAEVLRYAREGAKKRRQQVRR